MSEPVNEKQKSCADDPNFKRHIKEITKPGVIVRHFKRERNSYQDTVRNMYLYRVMGVGEHTETGEPLVVLRALYGSQELKIRPYHLYVDEIDHEKYPNFEDQKWRFEVYDGPIYPLVKQEG